MALINGQEYLHFFKENLLNNANKDGMNGSTPVSKKHNGQEQKIKNFFNLQEYFPVNGELLHHLLAEHQLNAMTDMKNYLIWPKENQ